MHSLIRKCVKNGHYTLESVCPTCGSGTEYALPPKYSPSDRFQKYRLELREAKNHGKNSDKPI